LVGPIFAEQIEVTIRHHALESGCFVINATGWLSDEQIESVTPDPGLQKNLRGGCCTAIISPEGQHLAEPLRSGEGMVIADLDMSLITKRKRMMDSVGHYARPELLSLRINDRPTAPMFSDELNAIKPSPEGEGWVRGNENKEESLFNPPHPSLLPQGEGAKSTFSPKQRATQP
jgi:aliphatic nitrilase